MSDRAPIAADLVAPIWSGMIKCGFFRQRGTDIAVTLCERSAGAHGLSRKSFDAGVLASALVAAGCFVVRAGHGI